MKKLTLALVAILLALTCVFAACGKKDNTPDKPADNTDTTPAPAETVKKDDLTKIAEQFKADYVANFLDLYTSETVAVIESEKSATLIKIQAATTAAEAQKAADDFFTFLKGQKTIIDAAKDLLAKVGDVALADEGAINQLKAYDEQLSAALATATSTAKKAALEAYDAATKKAIAEKVDQLANLKDAKKAADKKDGLNDEIKALKADYDLIAADAAKVLNLTDANKYAEIEKAVAAFAAEYGFAVGSDAYKEIINVADLAAAKAIVDKAYAEDPVMKYMAAVIAQRDVLAKAAEEVRWVEYKYVDKSKLETIDTKRYSVDVKAGATFAQTYDISTSPATKVVKTVAMLEDGTLKFFTGTAYNDEATAIAAGITQPVKVELRVNTIASKVAEYKLSLSEAVATAMEAYDALKAIADNQKDRYGFFDASNGSSYKTGLPAGVYYTNVARLAYDEIKAIADAYDQSLTDAFGLYNSNAYLFKNATGYTDVRAKASTIGFYTLPDYKQKSSASDNQSQILKAIKDALPTFRGTNAKGNDTLGASDYYLNAQKYGTGDYVVKDTDSTTYWFVLNDKDQPAIAYTAWQYHYELDGKTIPMNKFVAIDELFADNFVLQTLDASNYSALVFDAVKTAQNVAVKQSMNTKPTVVTADASFAAIATQTDLTKVAGDYETFVTDALAVVADAAVTDANVRNAYQAAADAASAYLAGNIAAAKNAVDAATAEATAVSAAVVSTAGATYMAERAANTMKWLAKYIGEDNYADSYDLTVYKDSTGTALWTAKTDVLYMADRALTEVADARVSKIDGKAVEVAKSDAVAAKLLSVYTVAKAIVDEQEKIEDAQAEAVKETQAAVLALSKAGDANAIENAAKLYASVVNGKKVSKALYDTNDYADYTAYTFVTTAMDAYNNDDVVIKEASAGKAEVKKAVSAILADANAALADAFNKLAAIQSVATDTDLKALLTASIDLELNKKMQQENADYVADYEKIVVDSVAKILAIAKKGDDKKLIAAESGSSGKDAAGNLLLKKAQKYSNYVGSLKVLFSEAAETGSNASFEKIYGTDQFMTVAYGSLTSANFLGFLNTVAPAYIVPASAWYTTERATSNTKFATYLGNIRAGAAYALPASPYAALGVTYSPANYADSNTLEAAADEDGALTVAFETAKAAYKGYAKLAASDTAVTVANITSIAAKIKAFADNNNADYLNMKVAVALFDETVIECDLLTETYREWILAKNYASITALSGAYTPSTDWKAAVTVSIDGLSATLPTVTSIKDADFAKTNYKPDADFYDLESLITESSTSATIDTIKSTGGLD